MKQNLKLLAGIFLFLLFPLAVNAQNCPAITSWNLVTVSNDGLGNCTYRVDFTMTVNGSNKSVQVLASCNGSSVLNQCISVNSGQNGITISTNTFTCTCSSSKSLIFNSFTNGSCGGASCTTSGDVLPVKLSDFEVREQNGFPCLKWTTAEESGITGFGVEYSADGILYDNIGQIQSNNFPSSYSYCDNIRRSSGFYRLRIEEVAGIIKYSRMIRFSAAGQETIRTYPNPAGSMLYIEWPLNSNLKGAVYRIYNITGQTVTSGKLNQNYIDLAIPGKSVYYLEITGADNEVFRQRFIKE